MSNIENLQRQEAVDKLKELAGGIDMCLFCTHVNSMNPSTVRPMSTQQVDDEGNIYFLSDRNSDKNKEIQQDSHVQLFYSDPSKASFLVVNGFAVAFYDRQKIEELWKPLLKTWFQGGPDDPNLSVIKVKPELAYYWDTKGNKMVNFFKMLASVATGKTLIDAEEGKIQVK
jgi:general stress protein 26